MTEEKKRFNIGLAVSGGANSVALLAFPYIPLSFYTLLPIT